MSTIAYPKINRRESLYYLLAATVLLFVLTAAGLAIWYTLPIVQPTKVVVGNVADFDSAERPYLITDHMPEHRFWVVNTGAGVFAFLGKTPNWYWAETYGACSFAWNEATDRFEDPCSGDKFALTGELIDASARGPIRTHLDQYAVSVTAEGQITVDLSTVIVTEELVNTK